MLSKTILKLAAFNSNVIFTTQDISDAFGIRLDSARVFCSRNVKKGLLVKLKNNYFMNIHKWDDIENEELLKVSNLLQVPSYISFMTALAYHEVSTQMPRNYIESATLKRSVKYEVKGHIFNYHKLDKRFYFGFEKISGIFIADKEKAFIDSVYMYSFGKYKIDFDSLDTGKLDNKMIEKHYKIYPEKTRRILKKLCRI